LIRTGTMFAAVKGPGAVAIEMLIVTATSMSGTRSLPSRARAAEEARVVQLQRMMTAILLDIDMRIGTRIGTRRDALGGVTENMLGRWQLRSRRP